MEVSEIITPVIATPEPWRIKKNAKQRSRGAASRLKAIEVLGGAICKRCGYCEDNRALQIDHIRGDGYLFNKHSRNAAYYRNIFEDPDALVKYQVLCANCNQIKKYENNHITRQLNERGM